MSAPGVSCRWEKDTREVYGVMEIMVNLLYYYCWRVVSEVHKNLFRCEHEATLVKPTKDMLMGSTGVVRPILPKSMVANFRHQRIINMNEIKDSTIT
jgi:hypothetical protein